MSAAQLQRLKSLLCVILGGIETNNPQLSIQAIGRMEEELTSCVDGTKAEKAQTQAFL